MIILGESFRSNFYYKCAGHISDIQWVSIKQYHCQLHIRNSKRSTPSATVVRAEVKNKVLALCEAFRKQNGHASKVV